MPSKEYNLNQQVTKKTFSRRGVLGGMVGVTAAAVLTKDFSFLTPPSAESSGPLSSFTALSESIEAAAIRKAQIIDTTIFVNNGQPEAIYSILKTNDNVFDKGLIHSSIAAKGEFPELEPATASQIPLVSGVEMFSPTSGFMHGASDNIGEYGALSYTNDGFITQTVVEAKRSNQEEAFLYPKTGGFGTVARFNDRYLLAPTATSIKGSYPRVWVIDTNIDAAKQIRPVIYSSDNKFKLASIAFSKVLPQDPTQAVFYSLNVDGDNGDNAEGLCVDTMDLTTGKTISHKILNPEFKGAYGYVIADVIPNPVQSNRETILVIDQSLVYYLIDSAQPDNLQPIDVRSLFSDISNLTYLRSAKANSKGEIFITGSYEDKNAKYRMYVAKIPAGVNPKQNPEAVKMIYSCNSSVETGANSLEIVKTNQGDILVVRSNLGQLFLNEDGSQVIFANREFRTTPAPAPKSTLHIPLTNKNTTK